MVNVGERLCEERVKRGYSLEEVSKATKIRHSFLLALEKGEYKKLPSGTYVYGFVRSYARFLGLPEHEILALFKRGYAEERFIKVLPDGFVREDDFPLSKIKFVKNFKVLVSIFIGLLAYIFFQYRSAIFNPPLSVSRPSEGEISKTQQVTIIGKTDPNAAVFVNSELAVLDKDGSFKKIVTVFSGRTKIIVKSINNFNKATTIERNIEVK